MLWTCSEVAQPSGPTGRRLPSKLKCTCPRCGANAWDKPALDLLFGRCARALEPVAVIG